jgi:hypothetical protein
MSKKYKKKVPVSKLNEPILEYRGVEKKVMIFSSFEEQEEYGRKQMALHSYEQRMQNLQILRNHVAFFKNPDIKDKRSTKTITIIKATYL